MSINKKQKQPTLNIFCIYILIIIIMDLIFYPLFPLILNYPPGSINTQFDKEFSKIFYYQQYLIVNLLIVIFGYICLKITFKGVDKWVNIVRNIESNDADNIKKIRKKSFTTPFKVYLLQILLPLAFTSILFLILGFCNSADIRFFLIFSIGLSLTSEISYLLSKKYFREVLKYTYLNDNEIGTARSSFKLKIVLQLLPLFLFSISLVALIGYSGLIKEKGDALFRNYHRELQLNFDKFSYVKNEEQIKKYLSLVVTDSRKDITFYINPAGRYQTRDDSKLSDFFLKYTRELAFKYSGHTYDYYGSDTQGTVVKLRGVDGDWIFGIKYNVTSQETIILFLISILILSLLSTMILLYFAKTITDDLTLITSGLNEITEGEEEHLNNKIAITSNDEIGDLIVAFNKVQDREKKHIQDLRDQQKIIIERERLASLGQMIGGIVHNLKTPIISLSDGLGALKDLITEYKDSIEDPRVTTNDHLEIANELGTLINEMKPYCVYMADILTTIKGQTVQSNKSLSSHFTLKDLLKQVEILTDYELTKSGCNIDYNINADLNLMILGEICNLVQVINNLVSNSIQAYEGKSGLIEFIVNRKNTLLEFCIKDSGKGIPNEIQSKLFREMITTKGKMGTGLGLYISYAIIKGKFGGDLWLESVEGKGTSFYFSITAA